jgi:ADP-ribose pyrophosphatase YjhB (NUDIX family)
VVDGERVLLLFHAKLAMWLPPGGHVEPNELPDDAAVREVREETGVDAELVGERTARVGDPIPLLRPEGVQLELIAPGHEHVDLVYFARRRDGEIVASPECERAGWYALDELEALGVNDEIRAWSHRAVGAVSARLAALDRPEADS